MRVLLALLNIILLLAALPSLWPRSGGEKSRPPAIDCRGLSEARRAVAIVEWKDDDRQLKLVSVLCGAEINHGTMSRALIAPLEGTNTDNHPQKPDGQQDSAGEEHLLK